MNPHTKFIPCPLCGALTNNPKWSHANLEERRAEVRRMRRLGFSIRAIMRAVGYRSPESVSAILRKG